MLHTIQVYRELAVLLVVFFHASMVVGHRYGLTPFRDIFRLGFAGVSLFFVLSGFIILTAHIRDVGSPRRLAWYLARRLIRIYPIYWLVLFVWGGWRFVSIKPDLGELALNALLFSAKSKLVIAVGWTLLYEIIFDAMLAPLGIAAMLI